MSKLKFLLVMSILFSFEYGRADHVQLMPGKIIAQCWFDQSQGKVKRCDTKERSYIKDGMTFVTDDVYATYTDAQWAAKTGAKAAPAASPSRMIVSSTWCQTKLRIGYVNSCSGADSDGNVVATFTAAQKSQWLVAPDVNMRSSIKDTPATKTTAAPKPAAKKPPPVAKSKPDATKAAPGNQDDKANPTKTAANKGAKGNNPDEGAQKVVDGPGTQSSGPAEPAVEDSASEAHAQIASQRTELIAKYNAQCLPAVDAAMKCCGSPESCLTNGKGDSGLLSVLQLVAGAGAQSASLSASCKSMETIGTGVAALNAYLATKCSQKVNTCKNECANLKVQAQQLINNCQLDRATCAGLSATEAQDVGELSAGVADFKKELQTVVDASNTCDAQEGSAQAQASQAVASAYSAKLMGLCSKATTSDSQSVALNSLDTDCSSASAATNPMCQNVCNRAGSENDPACQGSNALGFGTGSGSGLVDPNGKSIFDTSMDELENAQASLTDPIAPTPSNVAQSTPGGGPNLGGSGDTPSGGSAGYGGAPTGDGDSYSPGGIGSGIRTGSGYTSSGRSLASTGGRDFASFFSGIKNSLGKDGKPFNPKDYLPGGRLDPRRNLAGLAAANGIGAVHGDIFKNITNRFHQICLRNELMDCETVRKTPIGN